MNCASIKKMDIANGPGIRVSLFISGCNFHCKGCFNSEAWDFNYGEEFTMLTFKDILNKVDSDRIAGLSLLGGDPLWQSIPDLITLKVLCERVKAKGKTVWIWSGFTWEEVMNKQIALPKNISIKDKEMIEWKYRQELIKQCDVWVDGLFIEEQRDLSLQWRGSANQRIIDIKKSLEANEVVLYENSK